MVAQSKPLPCLKCPHRLSDFPNHIMAYYPRPSVKVSISPTPPSNAAHNVGAAVGNKFERAGASHISEKTCSGCQFPFMVTRTSSFADGAKISSATEMLCSMCKEEGDFYDSEGSLAESEQVEEGNENDGDEGVEGSKELQKIGIQIMGGEDTYCWSKVAEELEKIAKPVAVPCGAEAANSGMVDVLKHEQS